MSSKANMLYIIKEYNIFVLLKRE